MKIQLTLEATGKNTTGFTLPPEVVEGLGKGRKPPVIVTINGHTWRSTIAVMGGVYMLGVSAENRAAAGVKAGDELDVELELDTAPREVEVPADLREALDNEPAARAYFDGLSYSNKRRHVLQIEGAKAAETRQRRIEKSVAMFKEGRN
ncbi:MAG TPA: YdeI/OmpD-associated family protein [Actinomycetota bacterium]|nr:YdeI/OmpD-associated family protein [Actinomycetota bacterium]